MALWQIKWNNHFKIGSTYGCIINMNCGRVAHQLTEVKLFSSMKTLNISPCHDAALASRTLDTQFSLDSDEARIFLPQCKASSGQTCFTSLSPCRRVLKMLQLSISDISCLETPQLFPQWLISSVCVWWKIVAVCHNALEITWTTAHVTCHCDSTSSSPFKRQISSI